MFFLSHVNANLLIYFCFTLSINPYLLDFKIVVIAIIFLYKKDVFNRLLNK